MLRVCFLPLGWAVAMAGMVPVVGECAGVRGVARVAAERLLSCCGRLLLWVR